MTEAAPAVAAPAAPAMTPITSSQAATMLAERRAASAPVSNPSDAARILGQRAAEARKERQAQATQAQESAPEAEVSEPEDESPIGDTPGDETAETAQPIETEAGENEPEGSEPQTIELEPGLKVTLDEVRAGFMLKADHTRKTQALAEKSRELETKFTQTLSQLEKTIASLEPIKGQVKTRAQFIEEYGYAEGLDKWDEHTSRVNAAKQLAQYTKTKAQAEARVKAEQECDQFLIENYNKEWANPQKYEAAQVAISKHARALGLSSEMIAEMGLIPGAIIAFHDSLELKALKEKGGEIKRTIADKPKVTRPGAKVSAQAGAQSAAQTARAALKSSGSLKDAVAYLQAQRKARS